MSALPLAGRHVTDAAVRSFHWMFALAFAGAWLTAESERWRLVHVTLGYTLAGLLAFRLLWGGSGRDRPGCRCWHASSAACRAGSTACAPAGRTGVRRRTC